MKDRRMVSIEDRITTGKRQKVLQRTEDVTKLGQNEEAWPEKGVGCAKLGRGWPEYVWDTRIWPENGGAEVRTGNNRHLMIQQCYPPQSSRKISYGLPTAINNGAICNYYYSDTRACMRASCARVHSFFPVQINHEWVTEVTRTVSSRRNFPPNSML